jgi:hypothetical protein
VKTFGDYLSAPFSAFPAADFYAFREPEENPRGPASEFRGVFYALLFVYFGFAFGATGLSYFKALMSLFLTHASFSLHFFRDSSWNKLAGIIGVKLSSLDVPLCLSFSSQLCRIIREMDQHRSLVEICIFVYDSSMESWSILVN